MLFVLKKDKIMAFLVACSTVFVLFLISSLFTETPYIAITTSANTTPKPIYCVKTDEPKVSLTINCAWNADDIDKILEILKKENIKVTFFMVGNWIEKNKEVAIRIYNEGHEIANHSYSHPHIKNLNYDENVEQIKKCSDLIKEITGESSTLYRCPYGEYNETILQAVNDCNHLSIQWSIDTLDYNSLTKEQMWERIEPKLENGSIILMHNGTENTANSIETIIKKIKEKGYSIVTVSELVYKDNYIIDNNGMQYKK